MSAAQASERNLEHLCQDVFDSIEQRIRVRLLSVHDQVRIDCFANRLSGGEQDTTHVKLRWYPAHRELWIGQLRVASSLRGRGWGRRLVIATEQLAWRLQARNIHVFPLTHARGFWLTVGYQPDRRVTRLLTKQFIIDLAP